jgi:anti-anti-sigma factor
MFRALREGHALRIRMGAELRNVDHAVAEMRAFLQRMGLDRDAFSVQLVLREALANAVLHGSGKDPAKQVRMEAAYGDGQLTLRVEDQGPGFDWRSRKGHVAGPTDEGGRGLSIIQTYFDDVRYNEQGNALELKKHCQKGDPMSEINREGNTAVVRPGRDIVATIAQDLRKELRELVDGGVTELTIDLDGVEMVDSIGMGLFIAAHNSLSKNGGSLRLVNANEDILGLLRTMRLDKHFEVQGA